MNLDMRQIEWIAHEHRCGREIEEIKIDTGLSIASIKRALAEAGDLSLSWHKTKDEHAIITKLREYGVKDLASLNTLLAV